MAEFTLTNVARFPEGTEVEAHAVSDWTAGIVDTSAAPHGTAADTQTMTDGTLTFTGLDEGAHYVAYAETGDYPDLLVGEGDAALRYTARNYGTDITITYVDPGGNNEALAVNVTGEDIEVSLATDGSGVITTIATDIITAIEGEAAADDLVSVAVEPPGDGSGVVEAFAQESLDAEGSHVYTSFTAGEDVPESVDEIPVTLFDAKGDLLLGSADNAAIRKPIGTNGQVLTADSTAPGGAKWAAPDVTQAELDAVASAAATALSDRDDNYRTTILGQRLGILLDTTPHTTVHVFAEGVGLFASGGALAALGASYLDPADYAVAGKTTKYRVVASAFVNGTAPARTFTVGLHELTAVGGGADAVTGTYGAAVTGSTVPFASPSINTRNENDSGDFDAPAAGYYALGLVLSTGGITTDSAVHLTVALQVRNV